MKIQDRNSRAVRRQRRRRRLLMLAAVGLFAAAGVGYLGWNLGWTAAAEGDPAPPFVLPDPQGRQVALAERFDNPTRTGVSLLMAMVVASVFQPAPAVAQHAKPAGTPGFEHVHALTVAADGRTVWLGAHVGLFRSRDDGRTWQPVNLSDKSSHLDVMTMVGDPRDGRTLYVGTHEAGVFRTQDGGGTWVPMNTGIGGFDVHGLALDPNGSAKLHAAVRGQGEGIYRTTDAGGKWVRVDDGPAGEVKVLASVNVPTGMGGIFLYAGTAEGLLRSPDCF